MGALIVICGAAILWLRTARPGAAALAVAYLAFALLGVPAIFIHPLVYNGYGNVCEQLSLCCGALILVAASGSPGATATARLGRAGYYGFGICVLSFGLEQYFYLTPTESLVPKWIPPGQVFWAVATTAAFVLAAVALLSGIRARLAAQLTAIMVAGFGLLVWLPALFTDPHSFGNWSESAETAAIAATAWVVAEYLRTSRAE